MPRGEPVDAAKRAEVLRLADQGMGRNDIVRAVGGISGATVTRIVAGARERPFNRDATRAAVESRKVDLAGLRAELAVKFATRAVELLDLIDKPCEVFAFGGRENTFASETLQRPPAGDIRNYMTAAAIGAQRSLELTRFDSDQGAAKAGTLLDALAAGISEAARLLDEDAPVSDGEGEGG